jgi:hypothetical protein
MIPGRKPLGETALTGAERQARYRARLADRSVAPNPPAPASPRHIQSRHARWNAAIAILRSVQAEYANWLETLPEPLRNTPTGETLQAIVDLDLDDLASIYLPKGYGRD